jgi:hypothetical protein
VDLGVDWVILGNFKKKMKKDLVVGEKGVISTYETRI